jgi:hypothetical protein
VSKKWSKMEKRFIPKPSLLWIMSSLMTTATVASPKTKSLRATIPNGVVAYLGLRDGDKLEWRMEIENGGKVVLLRKGAEVSEKK